MRSLFSSLLLLALVSSANAESIFETWVIDRNGNLLQPSATTTFQSLDVGYDGALWGLGVDGSVYTPTGFLSIPTISGSIREVTARDFNTAWVTTETNDTWVIDRNGNLLQPSATTTFQSLDVGYDGALWGLGVDGSVYTPTGFLSIPTISGSIREVTARDFNTAWVTTERFVSVPESSSIYLLLFGLLGLFGVARRKV